MGSDLTFGSQSSFVLKLPGEDRYIAMFDLWNPKNFIDSRYLWLPIIFTKDTFKILWQDDAG